MYAGWAENESISDLAMRGIFFDETPNHASDDLIEYLNAIDRSVKTTSGILGDRLVRVSRCQE
jgi:hypothetical protein